MKTALIQQKYYASKKETVNQTVLKIEEASKNDVDLIVLQELHQTHYFCQNENVDVFDLANSWEEDIIFWANVAKANNVVLVTSLFEKRTVGLYHNTSVVFEKDGSIAENIEKCIYLMTQDFMKNFILLQGIWVLNQYRQV